MQTQCSTLSSGNTQAEGITKALKVSELLEWAQRMNNIHRRAWEVVLKEMIYCQNETFAEKKYTITLAGFSGIIYAAVDFFPKTKKVLHGKVGDLMLGDLIECGAH